MIFFKREGERDQQMPLIRAMCPIKPKSFFLSYRHTKSNKAKKQCYFYRAKEQETIS